MSDVRYDAAYSSDSGRAVYTAETILQQNLASGDLVLHRDRGLREQNCGTYEGETNERMWSDIAERQGITLEYLRRTVTPKPYADTIAELDAERAGTDSNWPAGDYETLSARLTESVDGIVQKQAAVGGGTVLIVSHGGSIMTIVHALVPEFDLPSTGVENASNTVLTRSDGVFSVERFNDTSHIRA